MYNWYTLLYLRNESLSLCIHAQFNSVQSLSHVQLFVTTWTAAPPCPSPIPRVHPNLRPSSRWCHEAISSSVVPFSSCPQSLAASESFPMSQLFTWGGQSTGISALASFFPKNTQDWSPLEWTGLDLLAVQGTLCNPIDCNPPGSSIHGILQASILVWIVVPPSRGSSQPGIKPRFPALQVFPYTEPPGQPMFWREAGRLGDWNWHMHTAIFKINNS